MSFRRLLPALLIAPLLATLAPRVADACSPPSGFTVERTFPAPDADDVGVDTNILVLGEGWADAQVSITVTQDGAPIEGHLSSNDASRYRWNPSDMLLPGATYDVRVESVNQNLEMPLVVHEFSFTTAMALFPAPVPPTVKSAVVEVYEREIKECLVEDDGGSCGGCLEWEVVDVEQRLRLVVDVEQPVGVYDGFYGSVVGWSVADPVPDAGDTQYQGPEAGPTHHVIDLHKVGEYPGTQVCVDVHGENPVDLYIIVPEQPGCIDISELNIPLDGETETNTDSDDAPTTGGDESSDSSGDESSDSSGGESSGPGGDESDGPEQDGEAGCGCRSDAAPGGSLAMLALVLGVVRPRRRAR
ncbi:MAG TPA: MYXO-CTERM sorting domain-containing protein [Nannocystis sp.]|jgi:MYXO-CTERM domain-containing protein